MGMKLVVVVVVDICRVDASNWGYGRISCVGGVMVVYIHYVGWKVCDGRGYMCSCYELVYWLVWSDRRKSCVWLWIYVRYMSDYVANWWCRL